MQRIHEFNAFPHLGDAEQHHVPHSGALWECKGRECKDFFQLTLNFNYHEIINRKYTVAIIPFQETYDGHKYIFECQHGEEECLGNMIEVNV